MKELQYTRVKNLATKLKRGGGCQCLSGRATLKRELCCGLPKAVVYIYSSFKI